MRNTYTIHTGDVLEGLAKMPDQSAHCCVTSPPYWGLRNYGVEGQIGLEATPEAHISRLVEVFRAVRRVLRDDGTLWVNYGDAYSAGGRANYDEKSENKGTRSTPRPPRGGSQLDAGLHEQARQSGAIGRAWSPPPHGYKPKDLLGLPWMLAFALRADGWYLRSDIIWHKPNPMPESVTDRPTKSHEYLFLLSKSQRYYYDAGAIAEPLNWPNDRRPPVGTLDGLQRPASGGRDKTGWKSPDGWDTSKGDGGHGSVHRKGREKGKRMPPIGGIKHTENGHNGTLVGNQPEWPEARNKRTVWTIPTQPYPEAHFATFPEALVEPCIKAGSPVGGIVLDPFGGSGTTGVVALKQARSAVLCELNPEYVKLARKRLGEVAPLLAREVAG